MWEYVRTATQQDMKTINDSPILRGMGYFEEILTLKDQLKFDKILKFPEHFENIVIAGMGGSGSIGRLFQELYSKKPVTVVESYDIPDFVDGNTFFIAVSYSGNTEETLSATKKALERGAQVKAITTGGRLKDMVNHSVIVPDGMQPRSATGYLLLPLLKGALIFSEDEYRETMEVLSKMDEDTSEFRRMAEEINVHKAIPVILSTPPFMSASYWWKTQFNENSKMLAYSAFFPELNHNDLVAMNQTFRMEEFYYILLESPDTDETIQKRIRLTEKLSGCKFNRIMGEGKSRLSHLFSLLHGSDFVTYYLAELRNVDPIDVQIIEDFKAEMGKPTSFQ